MQAVFEDRINLDYLDYASPTISLSCANPNRQLHACAYAHSYA